MEIVKEKTKPGTARYTEAVGRRKTAIARVRISEAKKSKSEFVVNDRDVSAYFPTDDTRAIARAAFEKAGGGAYNVSVHVKGGGIHAQSEAIRHGLSRALVSIYQDTRTKFKRAGFLKRDPRMVERKKFGKKKARRSPQWSKR